MELDKDCCGNVVAAEQQAQHTPGPWTIWPDADSDQLAVGPERGGVAICDVVITNGIGVNTESTRATGYANADFIARACNCHDDLLAALAEIKRSVCERPGETDVLYDICYEAIAKAEEVQQ